MPIEPQKKIPTLETLENPRAALELSMTIRRIYEYIDFGLQQVRNKIEEQVKSGQLSSEDFNSLIGIFSQPLAGSNTTDPLLQSVIQSFGSQLANLVFASPNGVIGNPTFRSLVLSDLPTIPSSPAAQLNADATILDINIINDGEVLKRVGATVVGFSVPKNNMDIIAPTVSDDNTLGYSIFSLWQDTSAIRTYICQDASTGAAIWARIDN